MRDLHSKRNTLCICATVALLSGCGGLQPPMGAPGAVQQSAYRVALPHRASSSYQLLYSFRGPHDGRDGERPVASLVNVNGTLYGTTEDGGSNDNGIVFSVTTTGTEKLLHRFQGGSDGGNPAGGLLNVNGALYGTTVTGGGSGCSGNYGCGTVFSITPSGRETVLHRFGVGSDGAWPDAGLIDVNGTLYGTTYYGGSYNAGTIFSVTTTGTENVLYSFAGGTDGAGPEAPLLNVKGTLYGTTPYGGGTECESGKGCGTVFSVTMTGTEKVLHSFDGSDGEYPYDNLTNVKGDLYGTTEGGGSHGVGTVFSVTTTGKEKVLHSFGSRSDGFDPFANLINVSGKLYGATAFGGTSDGGTVFTVTTTGTEKVLYNFGGNSDGANPEAGLTNIGATLYGTTTYGGGSRCRRHLGCGTVFALIP